MTVVVLNKDLKETGKRFTSLAIETSARDVVLPAGSAHTAGRIWDDEGEAGVDTLGAASLCYSATIERRTVMSSGFPPTMKMKNAVTHFKTQEKI